MYSVVETLLANVSGIRPKDERDQNARELAKFYYEKIMELIEVYNQNVNNVLPNQYRKDSSFLKDPVKNK